MAENENEGRTSYHSFRPSFVVAIHPDGSMTCEVSWSGSYHRSWWEDGEDGERVSVDDGEVQRAVSLIDTTWGPHSFLPQGEYPLIELPLLKKMFADLEGGDDEGG